MGSRLSSLRIPLSTTGHIDLRDIGITDEGLACLARFCPALLNLTISGSNITDTGIRDLLAVCTRLTALDVAHCQRVTLASLSLLKSAAKLQMVNITGIPLPVAAGMDFMRCLRLRGVCVRHSLSQLPQAGRRRSAGGSPPGRFRLGTQAGRRQRQVVAVQRLVAILSRKSFEGCAVVGCREAKLYSI
eukprot:m.280618 g.280618  ORF g.280618 m.280618 type:complete len:188 (+) comp22885_c4_seq7:2148-2711(+)